MKKLGSFIAIFVLSLAVMPGKAYADTLWVDDDLVCTGATHSSIQTAINAASAGDTIEVCAGTYPEYIRIVDKNLTLKTDEEAMIKPTNCVGSPNDTDPTTHGDVIEIYNSVATVEGFTIDVNYKDEHGNIVSGCLGGIYARGMDGYDEGLVDVVIKHNEVYNYGKNGITVNGEMATAVVEDNTVRGRGLLEVGDYAQNGIQFGWGASGSILDNTVSLHNYNGCSGKGMSTCTWVATGILLYDVDPMFSRGLALQSTNNLFENQYDMLLVTSPSVFGGGYGVVK